jgi:hypothetical protein
MRPMVNVALDLPGFANRTEAARAIDGACSGQGCAYPTRAAYAVHQCAGGRLRGFDASAPYELAVDVLEAAATLVRVLDEVPKVAVPALRPLVAEGLHEVERAMGKIEG